MKYFGDFSSLESIRDAFISRGAYDYDKREYAQVPLPDGFPTSDDQIVFAAYEGRSYDGDATVVFRDPNGSLKLVTASHCSCYGLEDTWCPSDTTEKALGMMNLSEYSYGQEARDAWRALFPKPTSEAKGKS